MSQFRRLRLEAKSTTCRLCEDAGLVTEEENSAFPSTTQDTDHVKQENVVDSSTSQREGNGSEIEIVVSS